MLGGRTQTSNPEVNTSAAQIVVATAVLPLSRRNGHPRYAEHATQNQCEDSCYREKGHRQPSIPYGLVSRKARTEKIVVGPAGTRFLALESAWLPAPAPLPATFLRI
jgi:hypothetical protein